MPPQGGRKHPHQEFIQIDTSNILFICGGAFDGLEKIIEKRTGQKTIGFGADIKPKEEKQIGELLRQVMPEDRSQVDPRLSGVCLSLWSDALDKQVLVYPDRTPERLGEAVPEVLCNGWRRAVFEEDL